jgi:hypothetical protein
VRAPPRVEGSAQTRILSLSLFLSLLFLSLLFLSFFFSVVHTVKGIAGHLNICDEVAYMKSSFFMETVLPLLQVDKACIVMISTPLDPDNFYTKMVNLRREDGNTVITVLNKSYVCNKCAAEGFEFKGTPCDHSETEMAPWKKMNKATTLIAPIMKDNQANLAQEIAGSTYRASTARYFDTDNLQAMFNQLPPQDIAQFQAPVVLTLVDPSGISDDPQRRNKSKYAMLSCVFYRGQQMVSRTFFSFSLPPPSSSSSPPSAVRRDRPVSQPRASAFSSPVHFPFSPESEGDLRGNER